MTTERFEAILDAQLARCRQVLVEKAKEYATEDQLHNFRVAAMQALAGMMAKHTVCVYDMAHDGKPHSLAVWEEKITDSINNLLLLRALVDECVEVGE